jgi:branched-chain amino acid transport system permease protein
MHENFNGIVYVVFNSLNEGLLLALITIAFQMMYKGFKFFDMSVGSIYIGSVYFYLFGGFLCERLHVGNPILIVLLSYLISILLSIGTALLTGFLVYNKFIKKNAGELVLMIISLSVYTVFVNFFVMIAGDDPQLINTNSFFDTPFTFLGSNFIYINLLQFLVSSVLIGLFLVLMKKSNLGHKITALSDNKKYFEILGLNINKTRFFILLIGTFLINASAILKTAEVGISPHVTGFQYVLFAVVAMIVSGSESYLTAILGSISIYLIMNFTEWNMPDNWGVWKYAIVFVILILILIFRPKGLKSIILRADE